MDEQKFKRRGWISACLAPIACVLFLLGQWAGLWESGQGGSLRNVLAGILIVEMLVGTVAPFWWLFTAFRRRSLAQSQTRILVFANAFALLVSLLFFF